MASSTTSFVLQRVTHIAAGAVRLRFSTTPKLVNGTDSDDAPNPRNFQFSGPNSVAPWFCAKVPSDPQAVDVFTNTPFDIGSWNITVASTVRDTDETLVATPRTVSFTVAVTTIFDFVTGGSVTDSTEATIRKHLPRSFIGRAWDAIIAAIASGDKINVENAQSAFDQLFLASASGIYLERRANEVGVRKPTNLGMSDDTFRQLAIKGSSEAVTMHSLWEVLEVFYGTESVRAHLDSEIAEPFALDDGETLNLFDGRDELSIVFNEDEFTNITAALAVEVVAVINRQARAAELQVYAEVYVDPLTLTNKVRLYSSQLGLTSSVVVVGGLAQNAFEFPTHILNALSSYTYAVSKPRPGIARYSWTSATPDFHVVREGDYVNLTATTLNAANRGTFEIVARSSIFGGATWANSFDVENEDAVVQAGPLALASETDVRFFRQRRAQLFGVAGREVILAQGPGASLDVILPATTQAVGRDELSAAYLPARDELTVSTAVVTPDGKALITTSESHDLAVGERVILDGLWPTTATPASVAGTLATAGNPGTTGAAQLDLTDAIRSDLTARQQHIGCLLSTGDVLLTGGDDGAGTLLASCSRFRLTGSATLTSGSAQARTTYSYNWIATAVLPGISADHRLTALQGSFAGKALRTGGRSAAAVPLATVQIYDTTLNSWTTPVGTLTARWNHAQVRVVDVNDNDIVYITGGQTAATTATGNVEKFTTSAGGTVAATALSEAIGRAKHEALAVTSTAFIVVGGVRFSAGSPIVRDDCWGYDEATATAISMGKLSIARERFALVKLRDGMAMAIGGSGRSLTNETTDRAINECEIWNNTTNSWGPAPSMRHARISPQAVVLGGKVYVIGGTDLAGNLIPSIEVFDIASGRWKLASSTFAGGVQGVVSEWAGVVFAHGGDTGASATANAYVFMPGVGIGMDANGEFALTSVPSATTFEIAVPTGSYSSLAGGTALPMGAVETDYAGPYLWNPDGDAAITAVEAVSQQALTGGQQYRTLTVDDASDFPDEAGWLALAYGTESAVYPVPYLGKVSDTLLTLDYSFKFPIDVPLNAKVTLLAQKGAYVPDDAQDLGSAYITGSSAGRVAAQQKIEEMASAGRQLNVTVAYPGDKGLGAAGYGVTGQKLSDKVMVWGGDDLDAELAAAREED
jgi:hypothetical protein